MRPPELDEEEALLEEEEVLEVLLVVEPPLLDVLVVLPPLGASSETHENIAEAKSEQTPRTATEALSDARIRMCSSSVWPFWKSPDTNASCALLDRSPWPPMPFLR